MPRRLRPTTDARRGHFHKVRPALPGRRDPPLQRRLEISSARRLLALDALTLRQLYEIDIGVAEVHAGVVAALGHSAVVAVRAVPDRLIVQIVPDHRQYWHAVPNLGPASRRAVHHRPVADRADHLAVRSGQLGAGRRADSPAQAIAGVGYPHRLVLAEAE